MKPWLDQATWRAVAEELRDLRQRGLARLLTEETVRFATVKALLAAGVKPELLRYERPTPHLPALVSTSSSARRHRS